jgi:hypothetical protein
VASTKKTERRRLNKTNKKTFAETKNPFEKIEGIIIMDGLVSTGK